MTRGEEAHEEVLLQGQDDRADHPGAGTTKPALVDVWSGPGQHSNGVQGGRAIAALNALFGAIDRPGSMVIPDKRGEKYMAVEPDVAAEATIKQGRFDELKKYP
jgi:anaerobic selenocysteine-containing dehydrogenase